MSRRTILATVAAVALVAGSAVGATALNGGASKASRGGALVYKPSLPATIVKGHVAAVLMRNGREGTRTSDPDAGGNRYLSPEIEAAANRAYPASSVGFAQTQRAADADKKVKGKAPKFKQGWQEIGPFTLNVDQYATQTYNRPTQWSGRVTALAIDPKKCKSNDCGMYVAAAGGGVWRSDNALDKNPNWKPISSDIPSTSIGALLVDPTGKDGKVIYAGTGEESGSSDSEAGIGLYRSTDRGDHWSVVPGSVAVSNNRGLGAIAVDPSNSNHLFIGTSVARHGASSVNGGRFTPPAAPAVGLYESTDGGASFHSSLIEPSDSVNPGSPNGSDFFRGGVTQVLYDPNNASTLYATMFGYGVYRSQDSGAHWQRIYTSTDPGNTFGIRYEIALADLGTKTRIYLGDGRDEAPDGSDASRLFRTDDASVPASQLTNGNLNNPQNPGWTSLSSPNPADPGFGSFDFCEAQCSYDMWVATPAGRPNEVWLGGSMHYGELPPYAGANFSDGRAVVRSTDAGVHWTDMTGDSRSDFEDQHPDTRDIAFIPDNPGIAFVGSDGGVIRTNGTFSNASSQCDTRGLSGQDLANCRQFLSGVPTTLIPVNAGLRTLQFESVSVNPNDPLNDVQGGTQDNSTQRFTGSGTWEVSVSGDGGASGTDVANPNIRYHTYFGPQGDVNFHVWDQLHWDWYMDPLIYSGEGASFYVPFQADPKVGGTAFVGLNHVWRTKDSGGDPNFLDNHCYTNGGPRSDALFTGACGDWVSLGKSLRDSSYGATRSGSDGSNYVVQDVRTPSDPNTLWAATRLGRVFISKNANSSGTLVPYQDPFGAGVTLYNDPSVTFTRIDDGESAHPVTPQRFVSGISIDTNDSNHAVVSYSGYDAYSSAVGTPTGHVFDVRYNPSNGTATWKNISYDLGDQPITGVQIDSATGDIYVSTDFGVDVLVAGTTTWVTASKDLPTGAVYGITLATFNKKSDDDRAAGGKKTIGRVLYAATHGRGVWRISLPDVKKDKDKGK